MGLRPELANTHQCPGQLVDDGSSSDVEMLYVPAASPAVGTAVLRKMLGDALEKLKRKHLYRE